MVRIWDINMFLVTQWSLVEISGNTRQILTALSICPHGCCLRFVALAANSLVRRQRDNDIDCEWLWHQNSLLGKHWNEGWCKHRISLFYPAQQVLDDYWILLASSHCETCMDLLQLQGSGIRLDRWRVNWCKGASIGLRMSHLWTCHLNGYKT